VKADVTKNIWDEENTSDTIRFYVNEKGEKQILAATLNKLIVYLTHHEGCGM
jgi:hypothetical protein